MNVIIFSLFVKFTLPCPTVLISFICVKANGKYVCISSFICVYIKMSYEFLEPNIMDDQFYRFSFIFNSGLFIFYWITYFMTLKPWTKSNSCLSCVSSACDKYKHTNHPRLDFIECTKTIIKKQYFNYLYNFFDYFFFPDDRFFFPNILFPYIILLWDRHTCLENYKKINNNSAWTSVSI